MAEPGDAGSASPGESVPGAPPAGAPGPPAKPLEDRGLLRPAIARSTTLALALGVLGAGLGALLSQTNRVPLYAVIPGCAGMGAFVGLVAAPLFCIEELARRRKPSVGRDALVAGASFLVLALFVFLGFAEGIYVSSVTMSGSVGRGTNELGELSKEIARTPAEALAGPAMLALGIVPVSVARARKLGFLKQLLACGIAAAIAGVPALVVLLVGGEAGLAGDVALTLVIAAPMLAVGFKLLDVVVERAWKRFLAAPSPA